MNLKSVIFAIIGIFLDKNYNYEPYLCNGCHDLMQKATNFNDVAIVSIKENDYRIHFWYTSKDDVINIMKNSNFKKRNRKVMLNGANEYYENNKEVLREKTKCIENYLKKKKI